MDDKRHWDTGKVGKTVALMNNKGKYIYISSEYIKTPDTFQQKMKTNISRSSTLDRILTVDVLRYSCNFHVYSVSNIVATKGKQQEGNSARFTFDVSTFLSMHRNIFIAGFEINILFEVL